MPCYDFKCPSCEVVFECKLPSSQAGQSQPCPDCGKLDTVRVYSVPGMVFAGDGWATKDGRVAGQMRAKNEGLERKQKERYGNGSVFAPNVGGEQTDTWADAKKLAVSKGLDGSSYDSQIRKETTK